MSFWSCCAMSHTLFVLSFWILSWVVLKRCIKTSEIKMWAWMSSACLCSWPERYCKCDYSSDRKLIKTFQIRATATNNWHHGLFFKNWHISDVNEIVHVERKWSACTKTSVLRHMYFVCILLGISRTPGKYPKEYIHDSKHGESLKSRTHEFTYGAQPGGGAAGGGWIF